MNPPNSDILRRLEEVIQDRRNNPSEQSYVTELLRDAPMSLSSKLIEEAYEVVHALGDEEAADPEALPHEAADLMFHLLVLLGWSDVAWEDVERKLEERFGTSGLEEKAKRHV
ncbi:MAG: phosphoribosyl-ATP diphosphatase [Planctomycetaceae bacterium]|nr:phosphoribosyl-ATP diphosphatase [Planctomycetaceae bacterium]